MESQEGQTAVEIDAASTDHLDPDTVDKPEDEVPWEPWKTVQAFVFFVCGLITTLFGLALAHDRVPSGPPLPDIILDDIIGDKYYKTWGLAASEYVIFTTTAMAFTICILHKHRLAVFRRCFLMIGLHYYYRAITMFVTVLPVVDPSYSCNPKFNSSLANHSYATEIFTRVGTLMGSGGLTVAAGSNVYCGDYIYSGHTVSMIIGYLTIRTYSPKNWKILHYTSMLLFLAGVICLLLERGHYTIDVLVAYWVSTRVWYIYHTLADGGITQNDFFVKIWWWGIFLHFEKNNPKPLPRQYSLPIPRKLERTKPFLWLFQFWDKAVLRMKRPTNLPEGQEARIGGGAGDPTEEDIPNGNDNEDGLSEVKIV